MNDKNQRRGPKTCTEASHELVLQTETIKTSYIQRSIESPPLETDCSYQREDFCNSPLINKPIKFVEKEDGKEDVGCSDCGWKASHDSLRNEPHYELRFESYKTKNQNSKMIDFNIDLEGIKIVTGFWASGFIRYRINGGKLNWSKLTKIEMISGHRFSIKDVSTNNEANSQTYSEWRHGYDRGSRVQNITRFQNGILTSWIKFHGLNFELPMDAEPNHILAKFQIYGCAKSNQTGSQLTGNMKRYKHTMLAKLNLCVLLAALNCRAGWIRGRNKCYKIIKQSVNFEEA